MKIRAFYTIENDVYRITLYTEDWSEGDVQLMERFGEPEIDLGGVIGTSPAWDLPNDLVRIKSGSPFVGSFDSRDDPDAESLAEEWAGVIVTRIQSAVTALRAETDSFSREEVTEV